MGQYSYSLSHPTSSMSHFLYSSICQWTFMLFPHFGYCAWCSNEYRSSDIFLITILLDKYAEMGLQGRLLKTWRGDHWGEAVLPQVADAEPALHWEHRHSGCLGKGIFCLSKWGSSSFSLTRELTNALCPLGQPLFNPIFSGHTLTNLANNSHFISPNSVRGKL